MLVELCEGVHGNSLVRLSIDFMHHLVMDNAKLLSYWAGNRWLSLVIYCSLAQSHCQTASKLSLYEP